MRIKKNITLGIIRYTRAKFIRMKKIYLAIPYSYHPEHSVEIADKVAAELMSEGYIVFSPISHGHGIADYLEDGIRNNSVWWEQQNFPFIDWCDHVYIIDIGHYGERLIEESVGVQAEIKYAKKKHKPIKYIKHG